METRKYKKRKVGDNVNGAVLVERVNSRLWKMKCKCGEMFVAQPSATSGMCRKCAYKKLAKGKTIHGEAPSQNKEATRLYRIWLSMRNRCNNKNDKHYIDYGGRGIRICEEWNSYISFKDWALSNGYKDDLSIDRINNNGNYEPNNCRWATNKQQARNTRKNHFLTYKGETKTIAEWAEEIGIKYHTLKRRINNYGFSAEDALTKPAIKGNNQNLRGNQQ